MPLQILSFKLDGITAADYLAWCRDPDPPALDFALRSIHVKADPLGDTITAILNWNQPAPSPWAAAAMAGLSLPPGVQVSGSPTDAPRTPESSRLDHRTGPTGSAAVGPRARACNHPAPRPRARQMPT
jgi:hypothetical protein